MEKLIIFFKKYNLVDLFLIFCFISILFVLSYGKVGSFLVDVGREAYLPWQMNAGEVLYRDLFNVYGPLGYQINALLFKIFGANLNTLYCAGFFNSVLISCLIYLISKLFVDRKTALSLVGVIAVVCAFSTGLFNFIFPYSYNAVYALTGLLFSLFAILLHIKNKNKHFLSLAFLFAGFSFANKIEYLPYFLFLFVCLPFFCKKNYKDYILPIVSFFVFPILSFGALMLQGAGISDFTNAAKLIFKVVKAPATEYFYTAYGLYFHPQHLLFTLHLFAKILKYTLPIVFALLLANAVCEKFVKNFVLKRIFNIAIFFSLMIFANYALKIISNKSIVLFCWFGFVVCAILFGFLINLIVKLVKQNLSGFKISDFDLMYLFLLISSIFVSFKGLVQVVLECYGTFSVAVMAIPLVVFLVHYVPKFHTKLNNSVFPNTIRNLCIITILVFLHLDFDVFFQKINYPIKTNNGLIFVLESQKSQQKLINFIKKHTEENSVIVSVPEGAIINFLTQRKGHGLYYYLIPGNIQAFGEDKIVADFVQNPPDYFLVNNLGYDFYNVGNFYNYAPKITDFIEKNYNPIFYIEDDLFFVLYKKKPVVK